MKEKIIDILKRYNPSTYPVYNLNVDFLAEEYQDKDVMPHDLARSTAEKTTKHLEEIKNISDEENPYNRDNTFLRYFLDGTRRVYYLYDMATSDGSIMPILAGQIAATVLRREGNEGKLSVHKYSRKGLILLPTGGGGLNEGDAQELKEKIALQYPEDVLSVAFVKERGPKEPTYYSISKLNMEMQNLEIEFLSRLTNDKEVDQENIVVVDGALQFRNIKKDRIAYLRYAIGLSKSFNLHLTNVIGKNKEIGSLLIRLNNVGDRTIAYKLQIDEKKYAFWYLRIRPKKYMNYPFGGIVKIEKVLVTPEENEDGLASDEIDNISRCILAEKSVSCYGSDNRWASHIYPIYLTEQVQKNKFMSDYIFKSLF